MIRSPNTVEVADPGNGGAIRIEAINHMIVDLTSGGSGETRTLAAPRFVGQCISMHMSTDGGGDVVITASAGVNANGHATITFGDAGDFLEMKGIKSGSALVWRVSGNEGVGLAS